jgi:hypothetical protein
MTVLEIMVALAVIVLLIGLGIGGLRRVTKADLVDDTLDLASALRRVNQLAIETGQLHRVVIDFEKHTYALEVCQGSSMIVRNQKDDDREADPRKVQGQLEAARQRLQSGPGGQTVQPANAEDAAKVAAALAGHHVLDRVCGPAAQTPAPDASKVPIRQLKIERNVKFKEVWVQHLEDSTTTGTVSIYFFPVGAAEKTVIELVSGSDVFTILIHGLSSRVEVRDGEIEHPEDHLMRDIKGDKEVER